MADTVINTFDLYNTTKYWIGYSMPGFTTEQNIAQAYYSTWFSSQPFGSQVDFFRQLAGDSVQNIKFQISTTLDELSYLWGKYWWDTAVYYSHSIVYSTLTANNLDYYQPFSESIGTLCYISRMNNLQNENTKPYNTVIQDLLLPDISDEIDWFYSAANSLFLTNKQNIGPGAGTDTNPVNKSLIQADTDLARRITSNNLLSAAINETYPKICRFLPYNTQVRGNNLTPYTWSLSANCEGTTIRVDFINRTTAAATQLTTNHLKAE
jgi:hypothetical protein